MSAPSEPKDCFHDSQGLRLHYVDWGNDDAPPLLLIHGGKDHCRSWDAIARALQPHFHVIAPDLRGHGDSDWAKGSSYSLADHVYDLTHLAGAGRETVLVGHSFGGMIAMGYAGTFSRPRLTPRCAGWRISAEPDDADRRADDELDRADRQGCSVRAAPVSQYR